MIFCGDDRFILIGVGVIDLDWLARIQISSNYCKSNVNCKISSKIPNSDISDLGSWMCLAKLVITGMSTTNFKAIDVHVHPSLSPETFSRSPSIRHSTPSPNLLNNSKEITT